MAQTSAEGLSLDDLVRAGIRNRRLLAYGLGGGMILAFLLVVLSPRRYTGVALVKARGDAQSLGGLSGLAAEFGVKLPTQGGGASPDMVAELFVSRVVLEGVATAILSSAADTSDGRARLVRSVEDRPEEERAEALARGLRPAIRTSISAQSGLVELQVSLPGPGYAGIVAGLILDQTRGVLERVREGEARESRAYFEVVTVEAADSLRAAEDQLREFVTRNRSVQGSPTLQFQEERLQREVNRRQEVALALYRGMAEATLAEQRSLSALSVVQVPTTTVRPEPRRGVLKLIFGALAGGCAAISWLMLQGLWARRATVRLEL